MTCTTSFLEAFSVNIGIISSGKSHKNNVHDAPCMLLLYRADISIQHARVQELFVLLVYVNNQSVVLNKLHRLSKEVSYVCEIAW
jgi:hypothetical protein